jgi:peroxiredoxin
MSRQLHLMVAALAAAAALFPRPLQAQSAATNTATTNAVVTKASWGPAVGTKAPAFNLVGQDGQVHALTNLLVKGNLALVFQRSPDWWPYCQAQLRELQSSLKEVEAAGGQVVVVSYESVDVLKRVAQQRGVTFLLLSDPGSKTIETYGILNREATGRAKGVPYPGIFILDRQGVIRSKLADADYRVRPSSAEVINALKQVR